MTTTESTTALHKVFLYPAGIQASATPVCIATLLGTCVAVCLWDPRKKIGGMNHYLLPLWNGEGLASPKYGNIAIERLIETLEQLGSQRNHLVAKIFGGRTKTEGTNLAYQIGSRNAAIARQMLAEFGIPIVAENLGGEYGMNIRFDTSNGKVMLKLIKGKIS